MPCVALHEVETILRASFTSQLKGVDFQEDVTAIRHRKTCFSFDTSSPAERVRASIHEVQIQSRDTLKIMLSPSFLCSPGDY